MPCKPPRPCPKCKVVFTHDRLCPTCRRTTRSHRDRGRASASRRGYGARWRRLRKMVLNRERWRCVKCGHFGDQVDHIVPRVDGGSDREDNLQTLCLKCHSRKTMGEVHARARA